MKTFSGKSDLWRFRTKTFLFEISVLFHVTLVLTYSYFTYVERPTIQRRMEMHDSIVMGTAPYQYRYRVLVPYAAEALMKPLSLLPGMKSAESLHVRLQNRPFMLAYGILNFAAIMAFLISMRALLKQWFPWSMALLGVLLTAIVMSVTFRDHYFHPWSFWEATLYALGLYLIVSKKFFLFTVTNLIGVVNRETSCFLPLMFLLSVIPRSPKDWLPALKRRDMLLALLNLAIWALAFAILHKLVGYAPATFTISKAWHGNKSMLLYSLFMNAIFLGPLWVFALKGFISSAPSFIRRASLAVIPYVALLSLIGFWWEVRYWIPMLPILIPATIASVQTPQG